MGGNIYLTNKDINLFEVLLHNCDDTEDEDLDNDIRILLKKLKNLQIKIHNNSKTYKER